jgi:hypothetical protein
MMNNRESRRFGFWVRWMLTRAGWAANAERIVPWEDLPPNPFSQAKEIVSEFYGLTVGSGGRGKLCGRVTLTFDPNAAAGKLVEKLENELGLKLYPLGEVDRGHAYFFVAEDGRIYMWFDDPPILVAHSFDDALPRMLLGLRYEDTPTPGV